MKCFHVEARDLPDAWFQCVDLCFAQGRDYKVGEGSYAGSQFRRELDRVTIHITHPQTRPMLPELPPDMLAAGIPNPVPEGMDYVHAYLPYLMTAEIKPEEQYTYGSRLFGRTIEAPRQLSNTKSINGVCGPPIELEPSQVEEVIEKFKRGFANNQATMTIAQPSDIHLSAPPCLRQIDCRVFPKGVTLGQRQKEFVEGGRPVDDTEKLHFVVDFRSWDLWGGFPPNLAAIVHLQEYMASEIGIEPGELICSSKGLHLYDMYWTLARRRLGV